MGFAPAQLLVPIPRGAPPVYLPREERYGTPSAYPLCPSRGSPPAADGAAVALRGRQHHVLLRGLRGHRVSPPHLEFGEAPWGAPGVHRWCVCLSLCLCALGSLPSTWSVFSRRPLTMAPYYCYCCCRPLLLQVWAGRCECQCVVHPLLSPPRGLQPLPGPERGHPGTPLVHRTRRRAQSCHKGTRQGVAL